MRRAGHNRALAHHIGTVATRLTAVRKGPSLAIKRAARRAAKESPLDQVWPFSPSAPRSAPCRPCCSCWFC